MPLQTSLPDPGEAPLLSVSIVSHGHGGHVLALLQQLSHPGSTPLARVWLTLNVPDPPLMALPAQGWPFELCLITNPHPQGFGANHNQAFAREQAQATPAGCFAVLNPDLSWDSDPFPPLLAALREPRAGCTYPLQLSPQGQEQDHRRVLPTPSALWRRHALGRPRSVAQTEWVNAAFLVFPAHVFAALGGFDTGYFMYCEDVDLSLRLQLAGHRLVEAPTARVVHDAHRASRRDLRHLQWHLRSLWRLWRSEPYRRFRERQSVVTIHG